MQKSVLNKQGNFGVKILWRYTDMAIFVLRCFILTHPVKWLQFLSIITYQREHRRLSKKLFSSCEIIDAYNLA